MINCKPFVPKPKQNCKPVDTPMDPNSKLLPDQGNLIQIPTGIES